ncbi:MAG: O-methyltransferase [Solirubrobacterales bacterium]
MSKFTALDGELHDYLVAHGARQDEVLARVQAETQAMGEIAAMQIAPDQGALMTMLCRLLGASDAIELGTFTGYSAICIARGLAEGGRLLACELSDEYAAIAADNFRDAEVADRIELRLGSAADTLRALPDEPAFDFAFVDADKTGYPDYYEQLVPRMRAGGLIVIDNVLAAGYITASDDKIRDTMGDARVADVHAIRATNDRVTADDRVDTAMVGVADGLLLARKR